MTATNHKFTLIARPVGLPKATDFAFTEEPVRELSDGEVLVKVRYISLDPAMRGWMNDAKSYIPPVKLGDVMRAYGIGVVAASKHAGFAAGDQVSGVFGVQSHAISDGKGLFKVPPIAPAPVFVSALGPTGLTAYFGLLDLGKPKAGDTVVVSAAAGAVGTMVGQIAKVKGCRVVGIAGGPEKCAYITRELGFDAAIDYKADDVKKALREHCPKGIDVYFDNVGGEILDAALANLAMHARVIICGAVSQYNNATVKGPSNYLALLVARATMTGFVVFDYAARYGEAIAEMAGWYAAGKLKSREDIVKGIEKFPTALLKLFTGENSGKLLLEV
jgi:NADPH-dependent curcumin reductase CurA